MKKILLIIFVLTEFLFGNGIKEKTETLIKKEFGANVKISYEKYTIPNDLKNEIEHKSGQRFFSESVFIWTIKKADSILAVGLMDNVYGKAQPITFITIFSSDGKIISNHIVKYREQYGGQISDDEWNKQFFEMGKDSDFAKIDGISGATISVNAIKKGVKKLTLLFDTIKNEYQ